MSRVISARISDEQFTELLQKTKQEGFCNYSHLLIFELLSHDQLPSQRIKNLEETIKNLQAAETRAVAKYNFFARQLVERLREIANENEEFRQQIWPAIRWALNQEMILDS